MSVILRAVFWYRVRSRRLWPLRFLILNSQLCIRNPKERIPRSELYRNPIRFLGNANANKAAERSLTDLKSLSQTSESQLAAGQPYCASAFNEADLERDLKSRPFFIQPFLLSCSTRVPKFAGGALICLHRLAVIKAIPKSSLPDVLTALKVCASLGAHVRLLQGDDLD